VNSYYDQDGITIYHGDCRDILPALDGIGEIVSDPPYGVSWQGMHSRKRDGYRGRRVNPRRFGEEAAVRFDDEPFDPSVILAVGVPVAITGAQYFYDRLPAGGSLHCWNKRGDYKPMCQGDADMIWCSREQASRVFNLVWRGLCRHAEHTERFEHPVQKPVALMQWMIELCGKVDCICDPYMGSGSTLVAAKRMNLQAIGIEIEERYCEIAARRLAQGVFGFDTPEVTP
jgi:hypothetical protein